jgi:hypothetical protein
VHRHHGQISTGCLNIPVILQRQFILCHPLQMKAPSISTKQLQLVGASAMFLAAKIEEIYPAEIGDFVFITSNAYTAAEIRKMEIEVEDWRSYTDQTAILTSLFADSLCSQIRNESPSADQFPSEVLESWQGHSSRASTGQVCHGAGSDRL